MALIKAALGVSPTSRPVERDDLLRGPLDADVLCVRGQKRTARSTNTAATIYHLQRSIGREPGQCMVIVETPAPSRASTPTPQKAASSHAGGLGAGLRHVQKHWQRRFTFMRHRT